MQTKYPHLFSPITIRGVEFRNRLFSVPIDFPHAGGGECPTPQTIELFASRARGGAAQVVVGGGLIDRGMAFNPPPCYTLDNPETFTTYKELAMAIKENGAVASMELMAGMIRVKGAVGVEDVLSESPAVTAMTESEMDELAEKYARAAAFAVRAGFNMLLVHFGHGGFMHQFLSPISNRRTDAYGGSPQGRGRLARMVLSRIRDAVGDEIPIELRLSVDELVEGGITVSDSIEFLKYVSDIVDLAHCSVGLHEVPALVARMHASTYWEQGCNLYVAEAVKKEVQIPVLTLGGYAEPQLCEDILASGKADVIGMNRSLLADPQLPNKVRRGREREVRPCVRCLRCHAIVEQGHLDCAVNPEAGREFRLGKLQKTDTPQTVLVAGGGVGGMQAAITAAERGHKVTLYEKADHLGGVMDFTRYDEIKKDTRRFVQYLKDRVEDLKVKVVLNTVVTPELIEREQPCAVIAAIGAEPITPKIKGIEHAAHVLEGYKGAYELGKNVLIIGGGLAGCEAALCFAKQGRKVTVVEQASAVARDANRRLLGSLMDFLERYEVQVLTNTACVEVDDCGIVVQNGAGRRHIAADSVLYAVGMRCDGEKAEALRGHSLDFAKIGDCVTPRQMMQAIHEGYFAARNID